MKKIFVYGVIGVLLLTSCGKTNEEVTTQINVDASNALEEIDNEIENETAEGNESTDSENVGDDNEAETSDNEGASSEGTDQSETSGDETDSSEAGGNDSEGGTEESTGDTSEEPGDEGEDATSGEETETSEDPVEEEIDYRSLIEQPYDDVDYSPQDKTTDFKDNPEIEVKGIFITANTAESSRLDDILELLDTTELNALVIDVKNDAGYISFESQAAETYVPAANGGVQIKDMEAFMAKMKEHNVYTIARIVTFKSPLYAKAYPDRAIVYTGSEQVYYADGAYWASPFDQELWKYNVEVAKEAIEWGFNEIQFDYVRFPATKWSVEKNLDFRNPNDNSKTFAIQEFVKYARQEINAMDAYVALDVFGWTATTLNDSGIGQHWEGMSNVADYMCPMVYPSHYGPGIFGIPVPDANPYKTIYEAMSDSIERNENIGTPAKLRPWLQAFTAKWVDGYIPYRRDQIQAQIQACRDLGINDYILWNASNNYYEGWFDKIDQDSN